MSLKVMKLSRSLLIVLTLSLIIILSLSPIIEAEELAETENEMGRLTSNTLRYKRSDNIYIAEEDVSLDYQKSLIKSQYMEMMRDEDLLFFSEDVHLTHEDGDQIWSQELDFDLNTDILEARKDVRLEAKRQGRNLELESQYLKIYLENDDILAKDSVVLFYDQQEIRGNRLEYSDQKEEIVVTEQAQIKDDGDWLKAEKIVIDLVEDSIDAQGTVELEFRIRD